MPGAYTSSRANGIQLSFWLQLRFKWRRNDVQPNAPAILHARELRIRQHKMMFWLHLSVLDIFCTSFNEVRSILSLSTYYVNRYYGLFFLPFNHMISGIYESVLIISSWLLFRTLERTNSQTLPASLSEVDQVIHFRYSSDLVHVLFYGVWSREYKNGEKPDFTRKISLSAAMEPMGLEPMTSRVWGERSSQLSYDSGFTRYSKVSWKENPPSSWWRE